MTACELCTRSHRATHVVRQGAHRVEFAVCEARSIEYRVRHGYTVRRLTAAERRAA